MRVGCELKRQALAVLQHGSFKPRRIHGNLSVKVALLVRQYGLHGFGLLQEAECSGSGYRRFRWPVLIVQYQCIWSSWP